MRVNKKEAKLLETAIDQWQKDNLLDNEKAGQLKKAISSYSNEFDSVAFYATVAAVSCALLAFGALVLDEKWIERLRNLFSFSEFVIGLISALLAAFLTWVAKRRKKKYQYTSLANESFTVLIALTTGVSVAYFTRSFEATYISYGVWVFFAAVVYGFLAVYLKSKILWVCMLLALIGSWGTQTYAWSGDSSHAYFLGMNYPLRMAFFGMLLIMASVALKRFNQTKIFYNLTRYSAWIFFLVSGLFLSASGNLSYDVWAAIKQGKLFLWALAYTILLIGLLVFSIKRKEETLRDITIVFFLLNIYTRYFEYFWNQTNKGIFFTLLALSFWLIAKKAEQLRKRLSE